MGLSKGLTEKVMVARSRNLNCSGKFLCGTCSVARKDIRIIGTRHGEKKYVTLVNREEMVKADTTPILPLYRFTVLPFHLPPLTSSLVILFIRTCYRFLTRQIIQFPQECPHDLEKIDIQQIRCLGLCACGDAAGGFAIEFRRVSRSRNLNGTGTVL